MTVDQGLRRVKRFGVIFANRSLAKHQSRSFRFHTIAGAFPKEKAHVLLKNELLKTKDVDLPEKSHIFFWGFV